MKTFKRYFLYIPWIPYTLTGIIVATGGDTDITLPTNTAKLFGNTWPKPPFPEAYIYKWEKLSGPEQGTMLGKDSKDVVLRGVRDHFCSFAVQ